MDYDIATSELIEWVKRHAVDHKEYNNVIGLLTEFTGYAFREIHVPNNSQIDPFFRTFRLQCLSRVSKPRYHVANLFKFKKK